MGTQPVPPIKPVIFAAVSCAALAVVLLLAFGSSPAAGASAAVQALTPTPQPVALAGDATGAVSNDPAADLTSAAVSLRAG